MCVFVSLILCYTSDKAAVYGTYTRKGSSSGSQTIWTSFITIVIVCVSDILTFFQLFLERISEKTGSQFGRCPRVLTPNKLGLPHVKV